MATNDEIRLDQLERRMDKYDEIIANLREIVAALKTRADTNYRWTTGLIGVSSAIIGAFIGHFVH